MLRGLAHARLACETSPALADAAPRPCCRPRPVPRSRSATSADAGSAAAREAAASRAWAHYCLISAVVMFGTGIGLPVLPGLLFESECNVAAGGAVAAQTGCNIFDSDIKAAARYTALMFAVNKITR